jgi:hypothetical protein
MVWDKESFVVVIVGHKCTFEGWIPHEAKVQKIQDWPECMSVMHIHGFLSIYVQSASNRYLEFGCYCPSGRQPDLKGVPFEWGKCQKEAMQYLKDEVVKSPVLH